MISILIYGRNDAHGYNHHRRAALSLNCLAEVLTDPDDEIVFVDYNTPGELPTFVEALSDTLTDRCLNLLRVLRVPAVLHDRRFAARTHLPIIEPVARNAAARRSNPSNRWLLSTNTDMILLPHAKESLSEICGDLLDGFYGLPRFELPEWLWEQLPRNDPHRALSEIARLGPGLGLDEPTVSHEWIRFDAPGDFQLILREDFFAIAGFDEEMLLGWHVDSNLCRRMFLRRGPIQSLERRVASYHCNHNRTPTIYHGTERAANDVDRFFFAVDHAELSGQQQSWGLADITLDEIRAHERVGLHFADFVIAAARNGPSARTTSDARDAKFALDYDSRHVLPFIADSLIVSHPHATIGYIGANPVLERMLDVLVGQLDLEGPLAAPQLDDLTSIDELDQIADVFVIDLGVDASLLDNSNSMADGTWSAQLQAALVLAFDAFQRLIELERARLQRGEHPRRFVLVNSSAAFWNWYVLAHLNCSHTTPHSRVRRATVKPIPDINDATSAAQVRSVRLSRWGTRRIDGPRHLHVRSGETLQLADIDDYGGFGRGWAHPDRSAVWTQGSRSELAIAVENIDDDETLIGLEIDKIGVVPDGTLRVALLANGARVATRIFTRRESPCTWNVVLPGGALADGRADLTLVIAGSWSDDRRLGLHLRSLAIYKSGWRRYVEAMRGIVRTRLRPQLTRTILRRRP